MRVYQYENDADLKILRAMAVTVPRDEDMSAVIDEMFEIMRSSGGIGLAAPQVGLSKRLFIVEVEEGEPLVFINPELIETSTSFAKNDEGCLSLPGVYGPVMRPKKIVIQAENRQRRRFKMEATGVMAVCVQHELDHLNGILFLDKMEERKRVQLLAQYQQLIMGEIKKG